MVLLLAKLVGTPLLVVFVSLVARRLGTEVGGLLAGMPLASGPVAGLLVAAHGSAFGVGAAGGILLGLLGAQAFIATYGALCRVALWPVCIVASFAAFGVVGAASYLAQPPLGLTIALVLAGLLAIVRALGRPEDGAAPAPSDGGWRDLALRAVLATAIVIGITAAAPALGARMSGILAPVPMVTAILAVFTHRAAGAAGARNLLRGVAGGAFSFWLFFAILAVALAHVHALAAFALATAGALGLQAVRLGARRSRRLPTVPQSA